MSALRLGRYCLGSMLTSAVLLFTAHWICAAFDRSSAAASCRIAVGIAACADLLAYVITARGVIAGNRQFLTLWGAGLLSKLGCLVAASVALVATECVQRNEYLLALAIAFLVFTTRQAVVLVGLIRPVKSAAPNN
ncbi:MAG: hypothetical protein EXS14_05420 [Planctomycetes bacterium]|nr:hypothetical protein [Planctomycetota bacterium]